MLAHLKTLESQTADRKTPKCLAKWMWSQHLECLGGGQLKKHPLNKDPIRTQNVKKVLIKDQVLKIRTLLEAVELGFHFWRFWYRVRIRITFAGSGSSLADLKMSSSSSSSRSISFSTGTADDEKRSSLTSGWTAGGGTAWAAGAPSLNGGGAADLNRSSSSSWLATAGGVTEEEKISSSSTGFNATGSGVGTGTSSSWKY